MKPFLSDRHQYIIHRFLLLCGFLFTLVFIAHPQPIIVFASTNDIPNAHLLNTDGTMPYGSAWTVNLASHQLTTTHNGAPIFTANTGWQPGFDSPMIEGAIAEIVFDNAGNLYIGGSFTAAGEAMANNIAKWDGVRWSAFGAGLNGVVKNITLDESGNL